MRVWDVTIFILLFKYLPYHVSASQKTQRWLASQLVVTLSEFRPFFWLTKQVKRVRQCNKQIPQKLDFTTERYLERKILFISVSP